MRVVWLAWYICGACLLTALLASFVTYHPDAQYAGVLLQAGFVCGAVTAGIAAIRLERLPPANRVHQSKPLRAILAAAALAVTLLLVVVG